MSGSAHQPPLRLVLDTNVVIAGLLWHGPPRQLIEWAIEGEAVELFSSPVLLDEVTHTLGYSKFAARAELIVTGDRKHPLPIGTHQGIAIVTTREVVDQIEARSKT